MADESILSGAGGEEGAAAGAEGGEQTPEQVAAAAAAAEAAKAGEGGEKTPEQIAAEKAEADKAAADKAEKDKKAEGAPEKYEDFTLPEGMELDKEALETFLPIAKELNLTQEQAQKLIDLKSADVAKQGEAWKAITDKWQADAKADKEYGGEKFQENLGFANEAIKAFGGADNAKAVREMLDITGTGNHPEMIRFMVNVGKAVKEGKIHFGQSGAAPTPLANKIYDTMEK